MNVAIMYAYNYLKICERNYKYKKIKPNITESLMRMFKNGKLLWEREYYEIL